MPVLARATLLVLLLGCSLTGYAWAEEAPEPETNPAPAPAARKPGFVERNLGGNSFFQAAQTTDQVACGDNECLERVKSIASQQAMMGNIGVATTAAAGAGVATYAYAQFAGPKPEGKDADSDRDALEKLAKLQDFAGKAMMGAGAVDMAMGAATRTVIQGRFKGIQDAGGVEDAEAANKKAGLHAVLWGAGKMGVGYLMHQQAEKTKENAENLSSVNPDSQDTNSSTTSSSLASQAPYQGYINAGNSNAPIIGAPVAPTPVSTSNQNSGSSVAGPELLAEGENNSTAEADAVAVNRSGASVSVLARDTQVDSVTKIQISGISSAPMRLGRDPASKDASAKGDETLFSNTSALIGSAMAGQKTETISGVHQQNSGSLFEITSRQLRSAAITRLK